MTRKPDSGVQAAISTRPVRARTTCCASAFDAVRRPLEASIWPPVTGLVTRNSDPLALVAVHLGQVRAAAPAIALAPLAHLPGMDASAKVRPAFLTQAEVAALLGVPVRTLEGWRLTRSGPPWLKLGRHVRYDRDDVLAWARGTRRG